MKRLAVIPSDPIQQYLDQGYSPDWLKDYYNPGKFFDEVYLLSELEHERRDLLGMKVVPTPSNRLPALIKELNINVVRAYGGNWACTAACQNKVQGVPVVVSVHDTSPKRIYPAIKKADVVLGVSNAVKSVVSRKFKDYDRIWLLPNRVDFKIMRPYTKQAVVDLDAKYPFKHRILHVGRKSKEKNLDTLIKALASLGKDYCVVAVGAGKTDAYEQLADSVHVRERIFFVDHLPHEELARYYSWADCMCTPSRREGFGMVFIEALACEAVVVTSDIAPLNEYIIHQKNGILVKDFEDPHSLAESIRAAATSHDLRAHLKKNARLSVEQFEKSIVEAREAEYYRAVLEMNDRHAFDQRRAFAYANAVQWVVDHTLNERGIVVSSLNPAPYLEVTGYLVPTLIKAGQWHLARQYADYLVYMQKPNGSFNGPDGKEYVFDSAQALRGLVEAARHWPEYKDAAVKTADFIYSSINHEGRIAFSYDEDIPQFVHLFALPPLAEAGKLFYRMDYNQAVLRCVKYYKQQKSVLSTAYLTHFLAYIIDALIDLGEADYVRGFVQKLFRTQRRDGGIPAYAKAKWVCSTGVAQFAIIAYKLGMDTAAERALDYLCRVQNASGGFYGSYGWGAKYFPDAEISWANKFFVDAIDYKKAETVMNKNGVKRPLLNETQWHSAITAGTTVERLAAKIKSNDYPVWSKPLLKYTQDKDSILELGSGTGELSAILSLYGRKAQLLDYSTESIDFAIRLFGKLGINADFHCSDMLKGIPLKNNSVDWVFSSGVLEHFSDEQIISILKESKRLAKKGVMCLVPNANSIFYRIGKHKMEHDRTWAYGHEDPKQTMQPLFEAAGLTQVKEFSVAPLHSLEFWGSKHKEVRDFFTSLPPSDLDELNQGYLLFTMGRS